MYSYPWNGFKYLFLILKHDSVVYKSILCNVLTAPRLKEIWGYIVTYYRMPVRAQADRKRLLYTYLCSYSRGLPVDLEEKSFPEVIILSGFRISFFYAQRKCFDKNFLREGR
jgi:hypothetical protein